MALVQITADPPLEAVDARLATYAAVLTDLRPVWPIIGKSLADESQRRWPLRRRSGRLRKSLTWSGARLGRSGIFQSKREKLVYGSRLFYAAFRSKRNEASAQTRVDPRRRIRHRRAPGRVGDRASRAGRFGGDTMKKTAAAAGKPRRVKASVKKSESHIGRRFHSARASKTPPWPWPPIRLTDRLANPDEVACPHCGRVASFRRSWCEHCGRATS